MKCNVQIITDNLPTANMSSQNTNSEMVKEFHRTFNHPVRHSPDIVSLNDTNLSSLRLSLIKEELQELEDAIRVRDMSEVADAICDLLYVTYGTAHVYGIPVDKLFAEVHQSNMSKLCSSEEEARATIEDYKVKDPSRNVDCEPVEGGRWRVFDKDTGKILKNMNWKPPVGLKK